MYNSILTSLLPVEEPLVIKQIQLIDYQLEAGISWLFWSDPNIEEFINKILIDID